jgi:hypothetical protein
MTINEIEWPINGSECVVCGQEYPFGSSDADEPAHFCNHRCELSYLNSAAEYNDDCRALVYIHTEQ